MKKIIISLLFIFVMISASLVSSKLNPLNNANSETAGAQSEIITTTTFNLSVPFTSEAPDGIMTGPWKNACEEASIVMIDQFYLGNTIQKLPKNQAKTLMTRYFNIQNKIFGSNANADGVQINHLINNYSLSSDAKIVRNPTLDQIKSELDAGRPVIALVYAKGLNSRIDFLLTGSFYHTFVIKGYDDSTKEFIVNDDGDLKLGLDLRYKYDTIMGALHDYNHKTQKTDGTPTVIFTSQRILAKTSDSAKVYVIKDNQKHYISSPSVFKTQGWKWSLVQTVSKEWLNKYPTGKSY